MTQETPIVAFNDDVLGSELEAQRKEKLPGNHFGGLGKQAGRWKGKAAGPSSGGLACGRLARSRGRYGTLPVRMGSDSRSRREGKAFPTKCRDSEK
ncbi:hypothetical protein GCM10023213_07810 [Prosthecobacter algae]|uniref:Uncharacterized protein n=1 Tax=Prosthecobacter algae TaxID=1144682 RepID=A0ABP9NW33_9BACT